MKEAWNLFIKLLSDYDMDRLIELLRHLKWQDVLLNPWTWLVIVPLVAIALWRGRFSLLVMIASFMAFVWLLQNSLPPSGQSIPLSSLLEFVAGTVGLVVVDMYFLFVREK